MQRLKSVLSSLPAKILIVPIGLVYAAMTMGISATYSEVETSIHLVDGAARGIWACVTLSQLAIVGAPYLINGRCIPRVLASVVYCGGAVVPTLYLYFYVVDRVYQHTLNPFVRESFVLLGVVVTLLYLGALLSPSREVSRGPVR